MQPLVNRKLIPIRELLAVQNSDPQMKSAEYLALYSAESWLLVHLIVLEGKYHSNFFKYFQLRDQGEGDAKAFAESFDVTYEDLDNLLNDVVRSGKITLAKVAIQDDNDLGVATRLSDAEAAGRLGRAGEPSMAESRTMRCRWRMRRWPPRACESGCLVCTGACADAPCGLCRGATGRR